MGWLTLESYKFRHKFLTYWLRHLVAIQEIYENAPYFTQDFKNQGF